MPTLWTIGHSTRFWDTFVAMLEEGGIATLVDVRRYAGSRRHPQFAGEAMAARLPASGIAYVPLPALGGRRTARKDSPNTAWRNASFRGYADYMEHAAYRASRNQMAALAEAAPTAVMCAEALWWQCHRGLIADDFKVAGWEVIHLMAPGRNEPHAYTAAARIVDGRLDYSAPAGEDAQRSLF
ncbi:MAG: DUF488 domain-containing protein [Pseudomonadota bacterium]|nr:DUF488 domain-containing protein [Pseudomonadota bacterium]